MMSEKDLQGNPRTNSGPTSVQSLAQKKGPRKCPHIAEVELMLREGKGALQPGEEERSVGRNHSPDTTLDRFQGRMLGSPMRKWTIPRAQQIGQHHGDKLGLSHKRSHFSNGNKHLSGKTSHISQGRKEASHHLANKANRMHPPAVNWAEFICEQHGNNQYN